MKIKKIFIYIRKMFQKLNSSDHSTIKGDYSSLKISERSNREIRYKPSERNNPYLSNQDIKFAYERAKIYKDSNDFRNALQCYSYIINHTAPQAFFYFLRASVQSRLLDFPSAIQDIKKAIELDGDNSSYYDDLGGYLLSNMLLKNGKILDRKNVSVLKEASNCYKISLQKDPSNEYTWINLIEINLFYKNWDDAISYFGSCRNFIKNSKLKLIRSFLGIVAFVLSGEEIDSEDVEIVENQSIRLTNDTYRVSEIESLIFELEAQGFDYHLVQEARKWLEKFISHFNEDPLRYGNRVINK